MNPVNPFMPKVNPFQPSGRMGIGGSQVPMPEDPMSRLVMNASMLGPQLTQKPMSMTPQGMAAGPPKASMGLTAGNTAMPASIQAQIDRTSGGVRPGAVPAMNAVEAARAQGMGGPPPGMGGRDMKDPRNAALAGYR